MGDEGQVRLLVIDDDPDVCELLRVVSQDHPAIDFVAAVGSPEEAVVVSRRSSPDAILLDHHFPDSDGMTGLEAVEFLRAVAPNAVIALYTGRTGLDDSAVNAGADLYLLKGLNPRAALDEIAGAANRRH